MAIRQHKTTHNHITVNLIYCYVGEIDVEKTCRWCSCSHDTCVRTAVSEQALLGRRLLGTRRGLRIQLVALDLGSVYEEKGRDTLGEGGDFTEGGSEEYS